MMHLTLPDKSLLQKTGNIDYFDWNYKFPIKYIQLYRFKRIIWLLGKKKYPVLLEAGTGSGILLPELAKHCDRLYASDIHSNFDHIHHLLSKYKVQNYNVSRQNIENTTYPDNTFDAIIAVSVLEFVNDLPAAIAEIRRILKPEGVFITICPMNSRLLDSILSLYSMKKPKEEFGESRRYVGKSLEENFTVINKGYMMRLFGRFFPVYTHYKLRK
jgi:ubiquinone/menaquinone biosynthesis C-methylase UbiE